MESMKNFIRKYFINPGSHRLATKSTVRFKYTFKNKQNAFMYFLYKWGHFITFILILQQCHLLARIHVIKISVFVNVHFEIYVLNLLYFVDTIAYVYLFFFLLFIHFYIFLKIYAFSKLFLDLFLK